MKVETAYNTWSATYDSDQNRTRDLDEQIARLELGDSRWKAVLELGCGTGKNTKLLADISQRVRCLDFSAGMIAKAKQRVTSAHVVFESADITKRWPVGDDSFQLVTCNLVLEHVPDLTFVFGEAARVLTRGGRLFISELHPFRQYQGTQARFEAGDRLTHIPAFLHHISDFVKAAELHRLELLKLREWWHDDDDGKPPRLISLMFGK